MKLSTEVENKIIAARTPMDYRMRRAIIKNMICKKRRPEKDFLRQYKKKVKEEIWKRRRSTWRIKWGGEKIGNA